MSDDDQQDELLLYTTEIASAYFSKNTVGKDEIKGVVAAIYDALQSLGQGQEQFGERPKPAVPINKSVTPDYLICLEDGKQLKMLKRHLMTAYSMTPEQYRERWGLPADYPMTAPNYAKKRSKLAKDIGLGKS